MGKPPLITCGIFLYQSKEKKLLVCHATHSRWNIWSVPKGLPEAGEDSWTVAVRELKEETGIDVNQLVIESRSALPPVRYQKQNKVLKSFLVMTSSNLSEHPFRSNCGKITGVPEIDSWKWITLEQARKWLHESQVKILDDIEILLKKD